MVWLALVSLLPLGLCGLWSTAPHSPPRRHGCLLRCHRARWQWGGDPPCYDGWSWDADSLPARPPDLSPQASRGPCQGVPQLLPCLLLTGLGGGELGRARARAQLSRRASWEGQSRDSPGVGASRLASLGPFPATLFPPKLSIRPRKPTTVPNGAKSSESKGGSGGKRLFPLLIWTGPTPRALPETRGSQGPRAFLLHPLAPMKPLKLGGSGKLGSGSRLPWDTCGPRQPLPRTAPCPSSDPGAVGIRCLSQAHNRDAGRGLRGYVLFKGGVPTLELLGKDHLHLWTGPCCVPISKSPSHLTAKSTHPSLLGFPSLEVFACSPKPHHERT